MKKGGLRTKLSSLKPVSWGKGTEHISEEVDKILYEEQYDEEQKKQRKIN